MKVLVEEITKGPPVTSRQETERQQSPQYKPPSRAKTPSTVKLPHIDHPPGRYKLLSRHQKNPLLSSQGRSSSRSTLDQPRSSSVEWSCFRNRADQEGPAIKTTVELLTRASPAMTHKRNTIALDNRNRTRGGLYRYRSSVGDHSLRNKITSLPIRL